MSANQPTPPAAVPLSPAGSGESGGGYKPFAYTRHWQGPVVHVLKTTHENAMVSPKGRVPLNEIIAWFDTEAAAHDAVAVARKIDYARQTSDERKALMEARRIADQLVRDYDRETRALSNEAALASQVQA